MRNTLLTIALFAVAPSMCSGHMGDRVVPVFEISDAQLADIDIHDGEVEDWINIIDEPSLTGLDLVPSTDPDFGEAYNPGDFDARIWLAWHRGSNRIYTAIQGVDDYLIDQGTHGNREWYWDSTIQLAIDGDHSGGVYEEGEEDVEDMVSQWQGVQKFFAGRFQYEKLAVSVLVSGGLLEYLQEGCCWFTKPPFADVGVTARGETPSLWTTEMYVTPFDWLVIDSQEEAVTSQLEANKVIGFSLVVFDQDDPGRRGPEGVFYVPGPDSNAGPDHFADALLVPLGGSGSAVEMDSWGRIKASLY